MKIALITGVPEQDDAYLAELLLQLGYRVYGTYGQTSMPATWRLESLGILAHPQLNLYP
jgi:GDPmannose 4,6-dehydratase